MTNGILVALLIFLGVPAAMGWALGIVGTVQWWRDRRKMTKTDDWVRRYNEQLIARAYLEQPKRKPYSKPTLRQIHPKDAA